MRVRTRIRSALDQMVGGGVVTLREDGDSLFVWRADQDPATHRSFRVPAEGRHGRESGDLPPEEHTLESMKYARVMLDQGFTSIFSAAAAKARAEA